MPVNSSPGQRESAWNRASRGQKILAFMLVPEALLMAVALSLGVKTDEPDLHVAFLQSLLGQGEVISDAWLMIARLTGVLAILTVVSIAVLPRLTRDAARGSRN